MERCRLGGLESSQSRGLGCEGNVEDTKTEGSAKPLPMDRDLADDPSTTPRENEEPVDSEWMFANPETGNPYWLEQDP